MGSYTNGHTSSTDDISISGRAIDEARPLKVIYIGAGVSGILAVIEFLRTVPSLDLVIYEKNPDIGGTWYENRSAIPSQARWAILTISQIPRLCLWYV